ncbi:MAG: hypothetical protein Q9207_007472 [Kuettlingeria erythrocarpa]
MPPTPVSSALKRKLDLAEPFHQSKKVAVEEAREASILAMSVHQQSPSQGAELMEAEPKKILEKIIVFVIGGQTGQTVHVELSIDQPKTVWKSCKHRLSYYLCKAQDPESAVRGESEPGCSDVASCRQQHLNHHVKPYMHRHEHCLGTFATTQPPRLSTAALLVSKQIYEIADHALLSDNTFAFTDPIAFETFMRRLHPARKAKVNKLQLALRWDIDQDRCHTGHVKNWGNVIVPELARAVTTGLKRLEVSIDFILYGASRYHPLPPNVCRWTVPLDDLSRIRLLCPRSVQVIVSENNPGCVRRNARPVRTGRLTWVEKRNMAVFYEKCLLTYHRLPNLRHEAIVAKWEQQLEVGARGEGQEG